jgi:hypothetical protein
MLSDTKLGQKRSKGGSWKLICLKRSQGGPFLCFLKPIRSGKVQRWILEAPRSEKVPRWTFSMLFDTYWVRKGSKVDLGN